MKNKITKNLICNITLLVLCIISLFIRVTLCDASQTVIHTFVALCDNDSQGIVPVPKHLGNGMDPDSNLYWGAMYGVKTFFKRSRKWKLVKTIKKPNALILERLVFKHLAKDVYLVADAYKGPKIKDAIKDFIESASGAKKESISLDIDSEAVTLKIASAASLLAYVGHDGLMEFSLPGDISKGDGKKRDVIILACISKRYFNDLIKKSGAYPLLWTIGFMAPEAYTLESAIEGWLSQEDGQKIRKRAAIAYKNYQNCTERGALNLFATGF